MALPYGLILLGALQCGVMVSNLLFGGVTMQVFVYYQKFPQDRWQLKAWVAVVWLLELGHTICIMHGIYVETITERGRVKTINIATGFRIAYYFCFMVNAVVQAFYAYRLKQLFENPHLAILCWFLTAGRFLSAIVVEGLQGEWSETVPQLWGSIMVIGLFVEATVDLIITTSMWYFLAKSRHRTTHQSTVRLLERLIAITIRKLRPVQQYFYEKLTFFACDYPATGFLTFLMAITTAVTGIMLRERNPSFIPLLSCQAKLYSNSMLASLNSRSTLRERYGENGSGTLAPQALDVRIYPSGYNQADIELETMPGSVSVAKNPGPKGLK